MPFVQGRPIELKTSEFLGAVYLRDNEDGSSEPFLLWVNLDDQSAYDRILQASWISMIRDAITNDLELRVDHDTGSALIEQLHLYAPDPGP